MKKVILHESKGRIRVHIGQKNLTLNQADAWEYYIREHSDVTKVKVYDRTGDIIIVYTGKREHIIDLIKSFDYDKACELVPEHTGRQLNRDYEDKLTFSIIKRGMSMIFLPQPIRYAISSVKAIRYILKGVRCLLRCKIEVPVLDATAIAASLIRGDHETAGSIMFLLGLGEILDEWTHKKSVDDLARTMSLNIDKAWLVSGSGQEVLVSVNQIAVGDRIVVRTGNMIPLDGKVLSGEAMVNQASITGESLPVRKSEDSYVYAGTVVEEGSCVIVVDKDNGSGRYDRIVKMIEESEKLKSSTEDKASHLADRLVPYSLGATALTYLITGNITKAISILMVDFSCALKLAMPISVLSAMRESSSHNISVKGGKFMEAMADADTIIFDKTGTLTYAQPKVSKVVAFGGNDENEMLRLAACLEEHYPHSMANAVITEAKKRSLNHEEKHTKVDYVVAHGIASAVDDKQVCIGSYHFIFQDEGCAIPADEKEKFDSLPAECSMLYLAISGRLAAVICIEDPLRSEARAAIEGLRKLGFSKIVMMTGDNKRTAGVIANQVGVDEYYAEVLPEDKAAYVKKEHELGRKVVMIGDGVNDSPALSEADVGIAISEGAAIAREIADITISSENLNTLILLRQISMALMDRINSNYKFIMSFNFMLIVLGVLGVLPPATSSLLHNMSTLGIGLKSMTNLIEE